MVDLSNDKNWLKVYDQVHVAQSILNYPNKHIPIQEIIIPTVLTTYTVAISSTPINSKPTWELGGKCYQLIDINNIGETKIAKSYYIGIGKIYLIKMSSLGIPYKICVEFPEWFKQVHLKVWVFKGEIIDSLEESLKSIQNTLSEISSNSTKLHLNLQASFNDSKKLLPIIAII